MVKQLHINSETDLARVSEHVEQWGNAAGKTKTSVSVCSLICEELLLHILKSGVHDISLAYKSGRKPCIIISFPAGEDAVDHQVLSSESEQIESEINQNILSQYADYMEYRVRNGEHVFRVYYEKVAAPDMTEEILAYYQTADPSAEGKPLAVLGYLTKKHPAMVYLSILNRLVKHLGALMLPIFASNIIQALTDYHAFFIRPILLNILWTAIALTVNLVCAWLDNKIYHRFTRAVESGFKMAIVNKLQLLSIKYHNTTRSGKILSKLVSDVQFIGQLIYENANDVLMMSEDVVFVAIVALLKMPVMLLFYLIAIPVSAWITRAFMRPIAENKVILRHKTETSNASFKEMLELERLTRSHGLQKTQVRNISTLVRAVQNASNEYDRHQLRLASVVYGLTQGFRLVCLCLAVYLASDGKITIGSVVLFQSLFDTIINSVQKVLDRMPQITQGYDSLASVNEILFEKDMERNGTQKLPAPVRGEILIDGIDIDDLDKNSFRRYVAVVPQNTVLFSGTLWENLVYGLNYISTARVMEVLQSVGLEDLVLSHPDGLNREILEGGDNLSGGQRQRIAIARALLREAKFILFDEATSALDAESEKQVQEAIESLMGSCTMLMVAHRLNTLRKADMIYRLKDGKAFLCESFEQVMEEVQEKAQE